MQCSTKAFWMKTAILFLILIQIPIVLVIGFFFGPVYSQVHNTLWVPRPSYKRIRELRKSTIDVKSKYVLTWCLRLHVIWLVVFYSSVALALFALFF